MRPRSCAESVMRPGSRTSTTASGRSCTLTAGAAHGSSHATSRRSPSRSPRSWRRRPGLAIECWSTASWFRIGLDRFSTSPAARRGLGWLKLKKALATLDCVVVGVEWGHGKRRGVLSDYTFAVRAGPDDDRLLTIGKAYTGLTDAEIATMTEHFKAITLRDFGRYRTVVPEVVVEIAFDRIMRSGRHGSGYAMRFPRILRIRDDKTASESDDLARVDEGCEAQDTARILLARAAGGESDHIVSSVQVPDASLDSCAQLAPVP